MSFIKLFAIKIKDLNNQNLFIYRKNVGIEKKIFIEVGKETIGEENLNKYLHLGVDLTKLSNTKAKKLILDRINSSNTTELFSWVIKTSIIDEDFIYSIIDEKRIDKNIVFNILNPYIHRFKFSQKFYSDFKDFLSLSKLFKEQPILVENMLKDKTIDEIEVIQSESIFQKKQLEVELYNLTNVLTELKNESLLDSVLKEFLEKESNPEYEKKIIEDISFVEQKIQDVKNEHVQHLELEEFLLTFILKPL